MRIFHFTQFFDSVFNGRNYRHYFFQLLRHNKTPIEYISIYFRFSFFSLSLPFHTPSIHRLQVVLSACSSYFQSLFLDHPSRHPIVILKDVRFAELRTLIEFMYKGEVNVQYCQLSALLKTAESLKVITNITHTASDSIVIDH